MYSSNYLIENALRNLPFFLALPENDFASSWSLSLAQCKQCKSTHPSSYLLVDIDLNDPHLVCERIPSQLVWVGVARQMYTIIYQGIYIYIYILSLRQLLE